MKKFITYAISIAIPLLIGSLIGNVVPQNVDYETLTKPWFAPPSIAFPIAWSILYTLMGISYGILKNNNLITKDINKIYFSQLIVNLIWPILFFYFDFKLIAFIWILFLIYLVINMIKEFKAQNNLAGLLQIPYLIWLIFAAILNISLYVLNR